MRQHSKIELNIYDNPGDLFKTAADRLVEYSRECVAHHGQFSVALAGGNTPRNLYNLLAVSPAREAIDWSKTYLFFGDERCVPSDHPDSNYRMAREALLDKVPVPAANVYRMEGENPNRVAAAAAYAEQLKTFFRLEGGSGPSPENFPRFDLILLGMGPDGHTASLFPGTEALQERGRPVAANFVSKLDTYRLTLTAPAINNAAQVWFLVTGADKAESLQKVLEGDYQPQTYPSQLIGPQDGQVVWFVERAAAAQLSQK